MFKSPIEYLKEMIQELVSDFANVSFDLISKFMLQPIDLTEYQHIQQVYNVLFDLSSSLCIVFVAWSIISILLNNMAGVESRSLPEVFTKAIFAFVLSASAPWLLENVLLKMNNAIVSIWTSRGLKTDTLEKFSTIPGTATITFFLIALVITVMFLLLAMQYIQRIGEYMIILVTSPIAAQSVITENFDIWPVWWREAVSVIFSQAYQVTLLWIVLNLLTGTEKLMDYLIACGLMVLILKGPKVFRNFIYSTGAGKMAVGMAGGATKMAMYKYAAAKITGK